MENKKAKLFKIMLIVFVPVFLVNISMIITSKDAVKQKTDADLETKRPANIDIIIIKDSSCADCADIAPIVSAIKQTNSKIIKEQTLEAASPEAKDLISRFEIKKIPTFIITGELNKNADLAKLLSQIGENKNDAFVFNYAIAPYLDLSSNTVKGKVTVTFIGDKSCTECYDTSPFKQILANNLGMLNPSVIALDRSNIAAQKLINKYKMKAVPAFVITGEISEYPNLAGIWLAIGTREKDGAYVLRDIKKVNPNLIYRDLATGKIIKPEAQK